MSAAVSIRCLFTNSCSTSARTLPRPPKPIQPMRKNVRNRRGFIKEAGGTITRHLGPLFLSLKQNSLRKRKRNRNRTKRRLPLPHEVLPCIYSSAQTGVGAAGKRAQRAGNRSCEMPASTRLRSKTRCKRSARAKNLKDGFHRSFG